MRRFSALAMLVAVLLIALPGAAFATDRYVAADGDDTRNTGLQGSPFATVQKAIDEASMSGGGVVYVGPGTFTGNLTLRDRVSLQGAGASETTLTVTTGTVITINSLGTGETISGFSITGGTAERGGGIYCYYSSTVIADNMITGNAATATGPSSYRGGAGVYCYGGAPVLRNNVISDNVASGPDVYGGGVLLFYTSTTLEGNTITGNLADSTTSYGYAQGGGIFWQSGSVTAIGNVIADNIVSGSSARGGGISVSSASTYIADNQVTGNSANGDVGSSSSSGGGIYLSRVSGTITRNTVSANVSRGDYAEGGGIMFDSGWDMYTPTISANIVTGNIVDGLDGQGTGGGISCSDGSPNVIGNFIVDNTATGSWGGEGAGLYCSSFWEDYVSRPVIANNVIAANSATGEYGDGGGAYFNSSPATVVNNTIAGNHAPAGVGGILVDDFWGRGRPTINNCILWGNDGTEISGAGIAYSCVDGGAGGAGNISLDPFFTDAASRDYSLLFGSSASDVASAAVAPADDIRGTSRPQGAGFDMGAYEYTLHPVPWLPTVAPDAYTTAEDVPLVVSGRGVLANDSVLAEDGPLMALVLVTPTHGELTLAADGSFLYTPDAGWSGADSFEYAAIDANGGSASEFVTITVSEVADPPVLAAIGDRSGDERASLVFTASATDEDTPASGLTFSLGAGAPAGAAIDAATGAFVWTPSEAQGPGTYTIRVDVSDGTTVDSEFIEVTVAEVAAAPVLAIGDVSVPELDTLAFTADASDEDIPADTLTFSLGAGAPAGMTIDAATGAVSWTTGEADGPGTFLVTVEVSDGVLSDSETFTVTVTEVNTPPGLDAIGPKSVDEHAELTFTAAARDGDEPANTLTFSLGAGAPAGAAIDPVTGEFTWTPSEAQGPGTHNVEVVVSDGDLTDSETIAVTVGEVASAPVLAPIGNKSVNELRPFTFTASASDADWPHDVLSFSLEAGAPAGAAIDAFSGAFSWTPTEEQGPGTYPLTIAVSDGSLTDTETITVTVAEVTPVPKPTTTTTGTSGAAGTPDEAAASTTPTATASVEPDEPEEEAEELLEGDEEVTAVPVSEAETAEDEGGAAMWPWWLLLAVVVLGVVGWLVKRKGAK